MGLTTTAGKYCYIQCDRLNCNRKMEHVDLKLLKNLAKLCGWEHCGDEWTCPGCARQAEGTKKAEARERTLPAGLKP